MGPLLRSNEGRGDRFRHDSPGQLRLNQSKEFGYRRLNKELGNHCSNARQHKKRARLSLKPFAVINAPCVIRTHDRLLRRQLLYPAELREHPLILTVDVRHPA